MSSPCPMKPPHTSRPQAHGNTTPQETRGQPAKERPSCSSKALHRQTCLPTKKLWEIFSEVWYPDKTPRNEDISPAKPSVWAMHNWITTCGMHGVEDGTVVYHSMGSIGSARVAGVWCAWRQVLLLRLRSGAGAARAPLGGARGEGRAVRLREWAPPLAAPLCLFALAFPGLSCPRV